MQPPISRLRKYLAHLPYVVETLEALPPQVAAVVEARHPADDRRVMIAIPVQEYPRQQSGWRRFVLFQFDWVRTPPRTLVFGERRITIVEQPEPDAITTYQIELNALASIELTHILLYNRLDLGWTTPDGFRTLAIEYSRVNDELIRAEIDHTRALLTTPDVPVTAAGATGSIDHLPLKFRNYLRSALLPDERVLVAAFQPPIRDSKRRFGRPLAPGRAIALTDRHLLVIDEGEATIVDRYAMTTGFYPLRALQGIAFERTPDFTGLHIGLGPDAAPHSVHLLLSEANAATLSRHLLPGGSPDRASRVSLSNS